MFNVELFDDKVVLDEVPSTPTDDGNHFYCLLIEIRHAWDFLNFPVAVFKVLEINITKTCTIY